METSVIDLLVPTDIQVDDAENNTSKITLEPLERGFGLTELSHLNLTILLCLIHVGSEHFAPYTN